MKKLFYIVLVVVLLFVIIQIVKNKQSETSAPAIDVVDTVEVEQDSIGDLVIQEDIITIDEDNAEVIDDTEVDVIEDIVEENPDETSGDGETIIVE